MAAEHLLRNARLERGLTLDEIVLTTRLRRSWAEKIDQGLFAELPPGVYARGYLRAYATAVGVDAEAVLSQLSGQLPEPADPLPALRELARERTPPTLLAYVLERLPQSRKNAWERSLRRHGSACVDAILLLALNAAVAWAVAQTCRVSVGALVNVASAPLAPVGLFTCTMYFLLLGGVGGRTPGAWLCGHPSPAAPIRLDLRTILRRAWHSG